MVNDVRTAPSDAARVKVYGVEVVLSHAGAHVPEIPVFDVVGKALKLSPEKLSTTGFYVVVTFGLTVMVNVVGTAHSDAAGEQVCVVVVGLTNAGANGPVIPLFEVVGKALELSPEQISATGVNVGVTFGLTVAVSLTPVNAKSHVPSFTLVRFKVVSDVTPDTVTSTVPPDPIVAVPDEAPL